jgi:hypothetical protein
VKTGSQRFQRVTKTLDTGFHRCDDFLRERQIVGTKYFMPRVRRGLEPPFLTTAQAKLPANPLDPVNPHYDAVIGQIPL